VKHADKLEKLKEFKDEKSFRMFLIDLFKKMGFEQVQMTHQYGSIVLHPSKQDNFRRLFV